MSGKMDEYKGKLKQAAGDLKDDDALKREGKKDEAAGKVKHGAEKVADKFGEVVDDLRD